MNSIAEFERAALELQSTHPETTRLCVSYRPVEGQLRLRVTNNSVCLRFYSRSRTDKGALEKVIHRLLCAFHNIPPSSLADSTAQQTIKVKKRK